MSCGGLYRGGVYMRLGGRIVIPLLDGTNRILGTRWRKGFVIGRFIYAILWFEWFGRCGLVELRGWPLRHLVVII